jgi:choline dehydrogenase-like flavoprotein
VNPTSQPASPKYCIFGAGAIGGTIAAQLARANATVSVTARGETLAAIRKDGLRLLINGETLQTAVRASADPAELGVNQHRSGTPPRISLNTSRHKGDFVSGGVPIGAPMA